MTNSILHRHLTFDDWYNRTTVKIDWESSEIIISNNDTKKEYIEILSSKESEKIFSNQEVIYEKLIKDAFEKLKLAFSKIGGDEDRKREMEIERINCKFYPEKRKKAEYTRSQYLDMTDYSRLYVELVMQDKGKNKSVRRIINSTKLLDQGYDVIHDINVFALKKYLVWLKEHQNNSLHGLEKVKIERPKINNSDNGKSISLEEFFIVKIETDKIDKLRRQFSNERGISLACMIHILQSNEIIEIIAESRSKGRAAFVSLINPEARMQSINKIFQPITKDLAIPLNHDTYKSTLKTINNILEINC